MSKFVSLRTKILVGFTLTFTIFFGGISYWFYLFTTQKTLEGLKQDLQRMAIAATKQINTEELIGLYQKGKPNEEGRSNDPRYQNQLQWLEKWHEINPKIFLFTFIKNNDLQVTSHQETKIIYLVDIWINLDSSKSAKFLESVSATQYHINTLTKGTVEFRDFYQDKWGDWITVYAPIRDKSGKIVAAMGADMEAGEIREIQKEIRQQFLIFFCLSYPLLLGLIYGLSSLLTVRFKKLQQYAEAVGEGNYQPNIILSEHSIFTFFTDERIILGKVLQEMAQKIKQREDLLNGMFNQVAVGIGIHTLDYKFKIVNQTLCRLLGYSEQKLLEKSCFDLIHPEDIDLTRKYLDEVFNRKLFPPLPLEKRCIHQNGEIKWFETAITVIGDTPENPKYFISVFQDITIRLEAEKKLIKAANTDFLTKLPNRAYLMQCLESLLQETQENSDYLFALLLVDIDNFQTINDSLGHLAGDEFLINIANHLRKCVTDKDIVA